MFLLLISASNFWSSLMSTVFGGELMALFTAGSLYKGCNVSKP